MLRCVCLGKAARAAARLRANEVVRRFAVILCVAASGVTTCPGAIAQGFTDMSLPAKPVTPVTAIERASGREPDKPGAPRAQPATPVVGLPDGLVDPALLDAVTRNTVTLIAGASGETSLAAAHDLAEVLEATGTTRLIPMTGRGGIQNAADLLHMKGIDLALIPSDVLGHLAASNRLGPNLSARVRTIARLFHEELHVLAGSDIASLADLAGRKVNIGPADSTSAFTSERVFKALGIAIEPVRLSHQQGLAALSTGAIAAMALVSGKPAPLLADHPLPARGLHLLPVPYTEALEADYLPARLAPSDYPGLVPANQRIGTIAVGTFVVGYNWADGHDRKARTARFVEALASSLGALHAAPRHAKWQEVSLSALQPGFAGLRPPAVAPEPFAFAGASVLSGAEPPAASTTLTAAGDARARALVEQFAPGDATEQRRLLNILSGSNLSPTEAGGRR